MKVSEPATSTLEINLTSGLIRLIKPAYRSELSAAVAKLIAADPKISIASITTKTGLSRRTIDRTIVSLKEKGLLTRQGAKNNATWILTQPET